MCPVVCALQSLTFSEHPSWKHERSHIVRRNRARVHATADRSGWGAKLGTYLAIRGVLRKQYINGLQAHAPHALAPSPTLGSTSTTGRPAGNASSSRWGASDLSRAQVRRIVKKSRHTDSSMILSLLEWRWGYRMHTASREQVRVVIYDTTISCRTFLARCANSIPSTREV